MKSMTGYAKIQQVIGAHTVSVEIKTLNSKQLDLNIKMPMAYRSLDMEVRQLLGSLERGKIDCYVSLVSEEQIESTFNASLVKARVADVEALSIAMGAMLNREQVLSTIISQNDVWAPAVADDIDDDGARQFMQMMQQAVQEVDHFRSQEGSVLQNDIALHIDTIEQRLQEIPQYEQQRIETAKERIRRYFEEFALADMNKERFEQELIYYLEKLDITEEKVRLQKHIDYFRDTMRGEVVCGKKLAFIAQEMGREINTTGSKANHIEIQRLVVQMKDELEKVKEQLGNIL